MRILAIETSCDETSVAVVKDLPAQAGGTKVLSCVTATSLALHAKTGGIIPENAARKQVEYILPVLQEALVKAFPAIKNPPQELLKKHIDKIAVTNGPGLIGSLLVGVETAKTLATIFDKPIIPVNHIKAHIYSVFLSPNIRNTSYVIPSFPLLALVASGGHTDFVYMKNHGEYERLGGTRDDAAGECFDKCARLLGLPYPGGPSVSSAAQVFKLKNINFKLSLFPRPMSHEDNFDVSFSGLKTSVRNFLLANPNANREHLAAEVETAIVDTLMIKTKKIIEAFQPKSLVVCGGVSANLRLREAATSVLLNEFPHTSIHIPLQEHTGDNAAMIAAAAFYDGKPEKIEGITPNPELGF